AKQQQNHSSPYGLFRRSLEAWLHSGDDPSRVVASLYLLAPLIRNLPVASDTCHPILRVLSFSDYGLFLREYASTDLYPCVRLHPRDLHAAIYHVRGRILPHAHGSGSWHTLIFSQPIHPVNYYK